MPKLVLIKNDLKIRKIVFLFLSILGLISDCKVACAKQENQQNAGKVSANEIAIVIPQYLIDQGIGKVGKLDLKLLVSQIRNQIEFSRFDNFALGAGGQQRSGSVCLTKERRVLVNFPYVEGIISNKLLLQGLLLHESLCSLGYVDDNYRISGMLGGIAILLNDSRRLIGLKKWLQDSHFLNSFNKFEMRNENQTFKVTDKSLITLAGGGSVTGVGGGGDSVAWRAKSQWLVSLALFYEKCILNPNQENLEFMSTKIDAENSLKGIVKCSVVREESFWDFGLNFNVETSNEKTWIQKMNNMPWVGNFSLERQIPTSPYFGKDQFLLTLNPRYWLNLENLDWTMGLDSVFLVTMYKYHSRQPIYFLGKEPFLSNFKMVLNSF